MTVVSQESWDVIFLATRDRRRSRGAESFSIPWVAGAIEGSRLDRLRDVVETLWAC